VQVKGDMMFPVPLPPVKSWKIKKHIIYGMQVDFGLNIYIIASFLTNILIFSHLISYGFVDRGCFYIK